MGVTRPYLTRFSEKLLNKKTKMEIEIFSFLLLSSKNTNMYDILNFTI